MCSFETFRAKPFRTSLLMVVSWLGSYLTLDAADVQQVWSRRYDAPIYLATDRAVKVACDREDNIIVTGSTRDGSDSAILTIKYSGGDGSMVWSQRYNGNPQHDDIPQALALDANGNVIVAGYSYNQLSFNRDLYVAKYASGTGALLWEKRYNNPANYNDQATSVAVDASGDVIVTGITEAGSYADFYTAKYAAADGELLWEKLHNLGQSDYARAVAVDINGDVVVTGSCYIGGQSDFCTVKYAGKNGTKLWEKRFNGPERQDDHPSALAFDSIGNILLSGSSIGANGSFDFHTIKYNGTDGTVLWTNRYDGPANLDDVPVSLAVDGNNDVIITGSSRHSDDADDYYTAKYSGTIGVLLWQQRSSNRVDQPQAVALSASGNVVVTGKSLSGNGDSDYYTVQYAASDGAVLWERRYGAVAGKRDEANSVAVDSSGNVLVTGSSWNGLDDDYYTAKYAAADGEIHWDRRYNGPVNRTDSATAVTMDGRGNVFVTGYSRTNSGNPNYYTAKYARADGTLFWERRFSSGSNDSAYPQDLVVDSTGNVIVTGNCHNETNGTIDAYTAKYAGAGGALLWEKRHDGPLYSDDAARAAAVDAGGNVVVTGISNRDGYTAKYAGSDGSLLWESPFNSSELSVGVAVVLDKLGNVFVTGYSGTNGSYYSYFTAKYAATNGAMLWGRRYTEAYGEANDVAIDREGNAVVTGKAAGFDGGYDYLTIKYAAADGAILWEKRYAGPANSSDTARAVAVDTDDNVVVTGNSYNGSNFDFYTAKYRGADGAVLWERRFNGPANRDDFAEAVELDAFGNVIVGGTSNGSSGDDYYTAKYAGTNGVVLWEIRYNGTANGNDRVGSSHALAVGPGGCIAITGTSEGRASSLGNDYATVLYCDFMYRPPIAALLSGPLLDLSWPSSHVGWLLQKQVNPPGQGLSANWETVPGSGGTNALRLPIHAEEGSAFFRLAHP